MLAHSACSGTTIRRSTTSLNRLPPPSDMAFPGLFAWSPVSTRSLTAALHLDRGLWATWRCRGICPTELPATWFRPAQGRPCFYMISDVLAWIAARHGEQLDTLTTWQHSLARDLGTETEDPQRVRELVLLYARAAGPVIGDVRFTPGGFAAYLDTLAAA